MATGLKPAALLGKLRALMVHELILRARHRLLPWAGVLTRPGWVVTFTLALAILGMVVAHRTSSRAGLQQLAAVAGERLELYASNLEAELARHAYLPSLMALDEDVQALLKQPNDEALRQRTSLRLARVNVRAGAILMLVADKSGQVIASSQPSRQDGLPPERLASALQDGATSFFATHSVGLGAAPGMSGSTDHVFVQPVQRDGQVQGLMLVKISLAPLEATWMDLGVRSHGEKLLVVDELDVVIMSSVPEWKFRALGEVSAARRTMLMNTGRYPPEAPLSPLMLSDEERVAPDAVLRRVPGVSGGRSGLRLAQEREVVPLGVRLMTLSDPADVWRNARTAAWGGGAVGAALGLLALYLSFRRRAVLQLFEARNQLQLAHDELERQVYERTRELRRTNVELKHQIAQRLQTEDELIQAGKLAVLGQMSAGISHEINQPLTALRALSRNTQLLLGQGRTNTVAENLKLIDDMVERMARITRQLKTFARKAESANAAISLLGAVRNTMLLLEHRLRSEGVTLNVDVPESLRVHCDANRLEQVLVNLFTNALDAMSDAPRKVLDVSAVPWQQVRGADRSTPQRVLVQVRDNGPGMPQALRARLFEPFFTTKPAGQGLGLGLVISSKIIHEFGGTLRAHARDEVADDGQPGMVFEFDLEVAADV